MIRHFTLAGGYLAHSLAIMTDAAHLLADVGSMMGSLFSLWLSTRPATRTMTFGWHRSGKVPAWPEDPLTWSEGTSQGPGPFSDSLSPPAETLGALASVVSLWMVTGILLYLAFIRLLHSDYHIEGGAMLLTASIAVCANLLYVPVWSRHHVGGGARGPPAGWESRLSPPSRPTAHAHNSRLAAFGMSEKGLGWRPKIQGQ